MSAERFRKKPVEVEAMRVEEIIRLAIEEGPGGMPEWLVLALSIDPDGERRLRTLPPSRGAVEVSAVEVRTKQDQWVVAENGEWIVCAALDDLWPVDPEVFEATYEPASLPPDPEEGGVCEALLSADAMATLYCHVPTITSDNDAGPSEAEERDLRAAVESLLDGHLPAPHQPGLDAEKRERLGSLATSLEAARERGQLTSPIWDEDATFLRNLASPQPDSQLEGRDSCSCDNGWLQIGEETFLPCSDCQPDVKPGTVARQSHPDWLDYKGGFPLDFLRDEERVRSAGDGTGACEVLIDAETAIRVEVGDRLLRDRQTGELTVQRAALQGESEG